MRCYCWTTNWFVLCIDKCVFTFLIVIIQKGGTMAKYGANVIKVDPVKPKYDPLVTVFMGMPINRNKR